MKRLLLGLLLFAGVAQAQNGPTPVRYLCATFSNSTTPAYTAGDSIGGKIRFLVNDRQVDFRSGLVVSATIFNKHTSVVTANLVLFGTDTSTTTFTDNAALDLTDADLFATVTGHPIPMTNTLALADNSVTWASGLSAPFVLTPGPIDKRMYLHAALQAINTPDFASQTTSELKLCLGIIPDR